ncbi:hypothetical protein MUU72_29805 [Streptomyces sp. RS10V-4]|uniref:hypothetical protein n=1 Tax=Streptomyces rhizoryzae TaxID=2932493 RepID=UPI00200381CA|nr:hypothetical protein [Streptomyces rhizoryzae]MCK7627242.1 hypothetical protein [Streptomyces rhizoryzae]
MSLPTIAIIVSSASALFTACSMLIAYATYRRAKPLARIKGVRVLHSPGSSDSEDTVSFILFNHGQNSTKVTSMRIYLSERGRRRFLAPTEAFPSRPVKAIRHANPVEDEPLGEVEPFGAAPCICDIEWIEGESPWRGEKFTHFRLVAQLSNGLHVYGPWHNRKNRWAVWADGLESKDQARQLSFDDLVRQQEQRSTGEITRQGHP